LDGGHGEDGVCAADRVGGRFGQAEVLLLAGLDEILDRRGDVLDEDLPAPPRDAVEALRRRLVNLADGGFPLYQRPHRTPRRGAARRMPDGAT
jgi:hypothetical protein